MKWRLHFISRFFLYTPLNVRTEPENFFCRRAVELQFGLHAQCPGFYPSNYIVFRFLFPFLMFTILIQGMAWQLFFIFHLIALFDTRSLLSVLFWCEHLDKYQRWSWTSTSPTRVPILFTVYQLASRDLWTTSTCP
jgi:hypothetical protein